MSKRCCVAGCGRKYIPQNKGSNASFFSIPSITKDNNDISKARRYEWLRRLHLSEQQISNRTFVCDVHFESGISFSS